MILRHLKPVSGVKIEGQIRVGYPTKKYFQFTFDIQRNCVPIGMLRNEDVSDILDLSKGYGFVDLGNYYLNVGEYVKRVLVDEVTFDETHPDDLLNFCLVVLE